ncbi:MAG: lytic transglycosylase domain-containing protein [Thermodesulfobacteriota bacterium]|nr:MAG: lytic transglycosylase domain-containing protein [Thermodesulfobacteriota bacterium]
MKLRHYVILSAVLAFGSPVAALADFYQYTDENGVVHITNVPTTAKYKWMMKERVPSVLSPSNPAFKNLSAGRFEEMIRSTAEKYGVDPMLVKAIVKAESDFDPAAVSKKGATGLMQLMPATASRMGVRNIHDPVENVEGGIKYLSKLLQMFKWQVPLAVAAYNAGENAVLKYGTIPPYSETQTYVKRVLHYHDLYSSGSR